MTERKFGVFTVGALLQFMAHEKPPPRKKHWMGVKPERCDRCAKKLEGFFVDGRTSMGMWGIFCQICEVDLCIRLGTGRGQKYNLETLEKIAG